MAPRETQPPSPREYPPESSDSRMHTPLHLFLAAQGGGRAWHHAGGEFPTRISEVDAALGLFPAPGKRVNWGTLLLIQDCVSGHMLSPHLASVPRPRAPGTCSESPSHGIQEPQGSVLEKEPRLHGHVRGQRDQEKREAASRQPLAGL